MIFVDTGPLLARYLVRDQFHARATRLWAKIAKSQRRCYTSNFVLDETLILLGRRASHAFAADRARQIYQSSVLRIVRPELQHEEAAIALFEKFSDQEVSFTDCISFALMKERKLRVAFSFDRHFREAGFELFN